MKHEEIKGNIAAFMDGEVKTALKDEIAGHIASCKECADEYNAMIGVDAYIKNAGDINPPAYFREKLQRKLMENTEKKFEFNILKLIPASAVLAVFVIFASAFMIVSPYIYAGDSTDAAKQVQGSLKSSLITCMTASMFSPAAFVAFCDSCSMNMCKCCMSKDPNHKCVCGGHNNGK
jgi:hypothetical protein